MFLVSDPDLIIACCKQGVAATFPSLNQRTSEGFGLWIETIKQNLLQYQQTTGSEPAPFGVNLVVHKTNPRIKEDLAVCVKHQVPFVVTSLGAAKEVVDAVHSYGGIVLHDVTNAYHAKKAAEAGVDGIIAVAGGAGGHAGSTHPYALIEEIRAVFDKTLILAGCMNRGSEVVSALAAGADFVYMGTRFIATEESNAPEAYKQMILDCSASQIIYTPAVSGVNASFMAPSLEQAGYDMSALHQSAHVNYGEKLKPADDEAKAWKTVWSAGQGCGGIHSIPTVEALVQSIRTEMQSTLQALQSKTRCWL